MKATVFDTLILKKGQEYVIDQSIEITAPTVFRGEEYSIEDAEPPALIRMFADPGEAGDKWMFSAAANLTLQNLGFIGFTYDNQQILGVCEISAENIDILASGCIAQGVNTFMGTNGVAGTDFVLHNNIHYNISYVGWDNFGGYGGPTYRGDNVTNHTYNNTYFIGGRTMASAGTGPNGGQFIDHNTYVNTFGETFHKCTDKDFELTNCILFNTHLRGYVGERINGQDTIWAGDYISYRQGGDTTNGDFAVFVHTLDSMGGRSVISTNNLKFTEQRALDWGVENNVFTQPFVSEIVLSYADKYGWEVKNNFMDQDGRSYDPMFEMGELPIGTFEQSWLQRLDRMNPDVPDHEIAWRPDGAEQNEFIWPLPFDFTPTNDALLTAGNDGYPLGDLNWFGKDVVAAWENGDPNPMGTTAARNLNSVELNLVNSPNPFSDETTIRYSLPSSDRVTMNIYDIAGAKVTTLVNRQQGAGQHEISFDANGLVGGFYFCELKAGNLTQVRKMAVIR